MDRVGGVLPNKKKCVSELDFEAFFLPDNSSSASLTDATDDLPLGGGGWGWDESKQLPIPPDDHTWPASIASNSRYASIMEKPYLFREEMDILCSKTTCRDRLSFGSNQDVDLEHRRSFDDEESSRQQFESSRQQFNNIRLQSNSNPTKEEDSFDPFLYYPATQPSVNLNVGGSQTPPVNQQLEDEVSSSQKRSVTPSSSTRSRKRKGEIDTATLQEYCALSRKLLFSASSSRPPTTKEEYTIKECLKKLKTLPDYAQDILYRAANLFKQADNRAVFMALDDEDKLGWVFHEDA